MSIPSKHRAPPALAWTFIAASIAAFMVSLDNLVVTMALPSIREHLHAGLSQLEWMVNAYTLTFAVLLLPAAALGDRLGRRRVFAAGLTVFTLASAVAALAPNAEVLVAARAVQGAGGAAVLPLSLTLLSAAVPAARRGAAIGVWGAMSGLAVALGPLLGGAITQGASWQYIFWLNVPIGVALVPLAVTKLRESRGAPRSMDPVGLVLVSAGLFALVFSLVRASSHGWTSASQLGGLVGGAVLIVAFLVWESRTAQPMLPLELFRSRGFSAVNGASLLMSLGMFGSVFLVAQYFQTVRGYSPLDAGLRTLPWTAVPVLIAPIAGPVADRIGGKPLLTAGLVFQAAGLAWLGLAMSTTSSYSSALPGLILAGLGMALFFVPVSTVALGSVPTEAQGIASGTNSMIRELGGVVGIAVLSAVFAHRGGYASPQTFIDGLRPAMLVGAAAVGVGAAAALLIPGLRATRAADAARKAATAAPVDVARGLALTG